MLDKKILEEFENDSFNQDEETREIIEEEEEEESESEENI